MDDSTKDTPRFVFLFSIAHYFIIITRTGARAPSFLGWCPAPLFHSFSL